MNNKKKLVLGSSAVIVITTCIVLFYQLYPSQINRYIYADYIEQELTLANELVKENFTSTLESNSAIIHFQNVLHLDKDNHRANLGVENIINRYINKISIEDDKNSIRILIKKLESLEKLLIHNNKVKSALIMAQKKHSQLELTQANNEKIKQLIIKSKAHLQKQAWLSDKNIEVITLLKQVLDVDSSNTEAVTILSELRKQTLARIHSLRDNESYVEAIAISEVSVDNFIEKLEFQKSLTELNDITTNKNNRKKQIDTLISRAKQQLNDKDSNIESLSNAIDILQQAIDLDSKYFHSAFDFDEIAKSIRSAIEASLKTEDYAYSFLLVNVAKSIKSNDRNFNEFTLEMERRVSLAKQKTERASTIKRFLAKGKTAFKKEYFIEPQTHSAFDLYRKVLDMEIRNTEAITGLENTFEAVAQKLRTQPNINQIQLTLSCINNSLELLPNNKILEDLQINLSTLLNEIVKRKNQKEKIASLHSLAINYVEKGYLVSPIENNAYSVFNDILAIDPKNDNAKSGLIEILVVLEKMQNEKPDDKSIELTMKYIDKSLELLPSDKSLLEHKKRLNTLLSKVLTQQKHQEDIESLHKITDNYVKKGKLLNKDKKNAYNTLKAILGIDPKNKLAMKKLIYIQEKIYLKARTLHESGELDKSLQLVDFALTKFPKNTQLVNLKNTLSKQMVAKKEASDSQPSESNNGKGPDVLFFGGGF